jgi:hypothetical protein
MFSDGSACVAGDVLVATIEGDRRVDDLVGLQFQSFVDGVRVYSTPHGFFANGLAQIYAVYAEGRRVLSATFDHPVLVLDSQGLARWTLLHDLLIGDRLALHTHARSEKMLGGRPYLICDAIEADGSAQVYDCTIPSAHAYDAGGGLYVANSWIRTLHPELAGAA